MENKEHSEQFSSQPQHMRMAPEMDKTPIKGRTSEQNVPKYFSSLIVGEEGQLLIDNKGQK